MTSKSEKLNSASCGSCKKSYRGSCQLIKGIRSLPLLQRILTRNARRGDQKNRLWRLETSKRWPERQRQMSKADYVDRIALRRQHLRAPVRKQASKYRDAVDVNVRRRSELLQVFITLSNIASTLVTCIPAKLGQQAPNQTYYQRALLSRNCQNLVFFDDNSSPCVSRSLDRKTRNRKVL